LDVLAKVDAELLGVTVNDLLTLPKDQQILL
jgi:hypothetical protein